MIIAQQSTAGSKRRAPTIASRRDALKVRNPNRHRKIQSSLRDFDRGSSPPRGDKSLGYYQTSLQDVRLLHSQTGPLLAFPIKSIVPSWRETPGMRL